MSTRTQRIVSKSIFGKGWSEFEVLTDCSGELESRTLVRTKDESPWIDIAIEEYTGRTRRAKYTSVRLEEGAARLLFTALSLKFKS